MKIFKFKNIAQLFIVTFITLSPFFALGQVTDSEQSRCEKYKASLQIEVNGVKQNISDGQPFFCSATELILTIINYLIYFSGTVSILFIMLGGFWYLTSAGNDEQAEKGQKTLTNAIIGLVVVIMAFTIVRIVNSTLSLGK